MDIIPAISRCGEALGGSVSIVLTWAVLLAEWSDYLTINHEIVGSIPGPSTVENFLGMDYICHGILIRRG